MALYPTTWNPSDKGSAVTLSGGNLVTSYSAYTGSNVRAVTGKTEGKWYWELKLTTRVATSYINAGVWPASRSISTYIYNTTGVLRIPPTSHAANDVFGFAFDAGAGTVAVTRNGVALGTVTGLTITEPWHPVVGDDNEGGVAITANFGATAFAYSPPAGFNAGIGGTAYTLSGNVKNSSGANVARTVRAYREDTGALVDSTTSNATTGNYSLVSPTSGAHTVIAYPAGGESLPALALRGVIPV